jgi:hypothetical protein
MTGKRFSSRHALSSSSGLGRFGQNKLLPLDRQVGADRPRGEAVMLATAVTYATSPGRSSAPAASNHPRLADRFGADANSRSPCPPNSAELHLANRCDIAVIPDIHSLGSILGLGVGRPHHKVPEPRRLQKAGAGRVAPDVVGNDETRFRYPTRSPSASAIWRRGGISECRAAPTANRGVERNAMRHARYRCHAAVVSRAKPGAG